MPKVEILKSGLMTSIQDEGRKGLAYYAIPNSGYIKSNVAELANFLVGNKKDYPVLECTLIPPHLKFIDNNSISITGDNFSFKINGIDIPINETIYVNKGDILTGSSSKNAYVAYIAFQGKICGKYDYQSISTYTNAKLGGIKGSALKKGDILTIQNKTISNTKKQIRLNSSQNQVLNIDFFKGPEFEYLDAESRELIFKSKYKTSPNSNRMGIRLLGCRLNTNNKSLKYSVPVLPGFIQLPSSGLPIIVNKDGQTTGGYPRVGYVKIEDLEKINSIGCSMTFNQKQGIIKP